MWTRIRLLGCFDTVAALGLPFKFASAALDGIPGFRHKFHDFRLSKSVENAYQALAIGLSLSFHLHNVVILFVPEFLIATAPYVFFLEPRTLERAWARVRKRLRVGAR